MIVPRKVAVQERLQGTAHRRSLANQTVQQLVGVLRQGWSAMGFQERGERLHELTFLGCSRRGLEKELKQSATSIRRHMVLAELPEKDRKAIAAGASAKDFLAKKAIVDRVRRRQERINEDGITGVLSDRIATTIIEFCRLGKELRKPPILTGDLPAFLDTVKCFLQQFGTSGYKAIKVSKKLESKAQYRKMRPRMAKDAFWIANQAEWLANIVWASAAEGPIRENALRKAENRAGELTPKKTPIQIYRDRTRRFAEILSPLPWRKMEKGARALTRQG